MSQAIEMKHDDAQYGIALLNDYPWSNGKALFAAGARFPDVTINWQTSHPGQANILETEVTTATRVAEFMFDQGLAQAEKPRDIRAWIESQLYKPRY
jgi:hypothetical protein